MGAPIQLDGERTGIFGIYRDITDRKEAEARLAAQSWAHERCRNSEWDLRLLASVLGQSPKRSPIFQRFGVIPLGRPVQLVTNEYIRQFAEWAVNQASEASQPGQATRPTLDDEGRVVEGAPLRRFVLNQDTGGAIRGPGRVDFFWGRGEEAERAAGLMQQQGRLFFLVPRR